jgi:hypothetical protein
MGTALAGVRMVWGQGRPPRALTVSTEKRRTRSDTRDALGVPPAAGERLTFAAAAWGGARGWLLPRRWWPAFFMSVAAAAGGGGRC